MPRSISSSRSRSRGRRRSPSQRRRAPKKRCSPSRRRSLSRWRSPSRRRSRSSRCSPSRRRSASRWGSSKRRSPSRRRSEAASEITGIEVIQLARGEGIVLMDANDEQVQESSQFAISLLQQIYPTYQKSQPPIAPTADERDRGLFKSDTIIEATSGPFQGLRAAARGGNKTSHPRARAFALCLAAAATGENHFPSDSDVAATLGRDQAASFRRYLEYVQHQSAASVGWVPSLPRSTSTSSDHARLRVEFEKELRLKMEFEKEQSEIVLRRQKENLEGEIRRLELLLEAERANTQACQDREAEVREDYRRRREELEAEYQHKCQDRSAATVKNECMDEEQQERRLERDIEAHKIEIKKLESLDTKSKVELDSVKRENARLQQALEREKKASKDWEVRFKRAREHANQMDEDRQQAIDEAADWRAKLDEASQNQLELQQMMSDWLARCPFPPGQMQEEVAEAHDMESVEDGVEILSPAVQDGAVEEIGESCARADAESGATASEPSPELAGDRDYLGTRPLGDATEEYAAVEDLSHLSCPRSPEFKDGIKTPELKGFLETNLAPLAPIKKRTLPPRRN